MNFTSDSHFHEDSIVELSELDLETIAGGGWFKKLTGISTPSFLKDLDDDVREHVDGGWAGLIAIGGLAMGGGSCVEIASRLVCRF